MSNLDKYFHMASHGDKEAYQLLYKEFVDKANSVVRTTIQNYSKFQGIPEDFCDVIDDLFFEAINEFEQEKKSFSTYVDYLLSHRLVGAVKSEIHRIQTYIADIDYDDSEVKAVELLPDPDHSSMAGELAIMRFKAEIATPSSHKTKEQRLRDRVLTLLYAGYKNKEICDKLNITYAQLRRVLEKIEDDEEINNIKLDLK